MSETSAALWFHTLAPGGERLFRIAPVRIPRRIVLPSCGEVSVEREPGGEVRVIPRGSSIRCSAFPEGSILVRCGDVLKIASGKSFLVGWKSLSVLAALLVMTALVAPALSSRDKPAKLPPSPKKASARSKPAVAPTPSPTPKVTTMNRQAEKSVESPLKQIRAKTPQRRPKDPGWGKIERSVRAAFARAEFAQALSELSDVAFDGRREVPASLRQLAAEVNYAVCARAFEGEHWREVVKQCERAVHLNGHVRAARLLEQMGERARKLYLEGYVMEKTNRVAAVGRYREVLELAPTGSEFRGKARRKLKSFQGRSVD